MLLITSSVTPSGAVAPGFMAPAATWSAGHSPACAGMAAKMAAAASGCAGDLNGEVAADCEGMWAVSPVSSPRWMSCGHGWESGGAAVEKMRGLWWESCAMRQED